MPLFASVGFQCSYALLLLVLVSVWLVVASLLVALGLLEFDSVG
jgi:hypothetical protein